MFVSDCFQISRIGWKRQMHILIAEDEARMAQLLRSAFVEEGHTVAVAADGVSAVEFAQASQFDVIVLDVMLPRLDGLQVVRRLRELKDQTPVLMLTARDTPSDIVRALDGGADDYLTKPFSFEILLARVRSVSRRGRIPQAVCQTIGDLTLNMSTREISRGERKISLTPREYSLLEFLMRHKGRVVTRQRMLEAIWGFDADVEENTVEAFIRLLRNKVEAPHESKLIHTVRGVGYALREPEQ
jgi:DNA-binding response OmpR family regulator